MPIVGPSKGDLKVWWVPQLPGEPFHVAVASPVEARKVLTVLADYDLFQFENKIKPDYSNAGGLDVFDGNDWVEWLDEHGCDITEQDANLTFSGVVA